MCPAGCGTIVTTNIEGQVTAVDPDPDNALSRGYACFKGLSSAQAHAPHNRMLHPSKRSAEGHRVAITSQQALEEITVQLQETIDQYGPNSVALYCGNSASLIPSAYFSHHAFLKAIGSRQYFSTVTIDHSSKYVSSGRLGFWPAGHPPISEVDFAVLVGANPMISHAAIGVAHYDPVRQIKHEKNRGLELAVIDPRTTETAHFATQHLRIKPGADVALAGTVLKLILDNQWHDLEFCNNYLKAGALETFSLTLEAFDLDFSQQITGIPAEEIMRFAKRFARESKRGFIYTSTGVSFSPHSNLAQHLYDCINVICGRFLRAGDEVHQYDVLKPAKDTFEGVTPPTRPWRVQGNSRIRGAYSLYGERPTPTLSDEILAEGNDKIRALIVDGGDPITAFPDSEKTRRALEQLELLVCIDPAMSATARLSAYHLPSVMQYERADISAVRDGVPLWPGSWAQHTEAVASIPSNADIVEDWYVFWKLATGLGHQLRINNKPIGKGGSPDIHEVHGAILNKAVVSLAQLKQYPGGHYHEIPPRRVKHARTRRFKFDIIPEDVRDEIAQYLVASRESTKSLVLVSRRTRDLVNSTGTSVDAIRERNSGNSTGINPDDIARYGWHAGQRVRITSDHGSCISFLKADASLLPGTISLAHGWENRSQESPSTNVNDLTSCTADCQAISVMPAFTGLAVQIEPLNEANS